MSRGVCMSFDYLVLGNGAIGMFAAIRLKEEFPSARVGIIGNPARRNSASVAAGAMCNVYGEIENAASTNMKALQEISLAFGVAGRSGWIDFLNTHNLRQKLVSADKTLIFLKDNASAFESGNFARAKEASLEAGIYQEVETTKLESLFAQAESVPREAFLIDGEFALDSKELFLTFSALCETLGIQVLGAEIENIEIGKRVVKTNIGIFSAEKIIVALGAETQKIIGLDSIQSVLRGVGTAFQISNRVIDASFASERMVIRTVNRGGAQCGFHFVPRKNGYYLGAGNYIKADGESSHRLETLRYLINTFESELGGSEITYLLEGDIIKGHRPRALDGFPLIGSLISDGSIFVASGTNRAGLTWAPAIARQVISWAKGENQDVISPEQAKLISPERRPINFGSELEAIDYYVESRIGAAIEHGKLENRSEFIDIERSRLREYANELLQKVQTLTGLDMVPHPDHWAAILDKPSLCVVSK